jgi:hypothetical protein
MGVKYDLEPLDKQWIAVSLQAKRQQLVRSMKNEVAMSEIYNLRAREIAAIDVLIGKFL